MKSKEIVSTQKLKGAYYTPFPLAEAMVKLSANKPGIREILEPSCGDGVFLDAIKERNHIKIDAIELDKTACEEVKNKIETYQNLHQNSYQSPHQNLYPTPYQNIRIINKDFFEFYEENKNSVQYDLILGNPPYIRYQYLDESQRKLMSEILVSYGMKANKLINAWVAFLVACVQLLSASGTIAFVIPAEILQVAYAEDLRLYLSNNLKKITLITFKQLVFPDIEQEVIVFLGEKSGTDSGIRVIEVNDLSEMKKLNLTDHKFSPLPHTKEKWTKYFISPDEMEVIRSIKEDHRFVRFSDLGLINVGITTGNNKYFSVNSKTAAEYRLEKISLPLIGKSSHAHGIYFTEQDWENNLKNGKRAYLVNLPEIPYEDYPDPHKKYIQYGKNRGVHTGYKCSIRDRWYIVPSVWIPDAFLTRMNNFYPRFILNRCGAVSTDALNRIQFKDGINAEDVLLSYYNSISFAFTEICGRSHGGGVLEILPSEMGNIMLPVISSVDKTLKKGLLDHIDRIIRNNDDIEKTLDIVDQRILTDALAIDPTWCSACRKVWKKLQKRRLGRRRNSSH